MAEDLNFVILFGNVTVLYTFVLHWALSIQHCDLIKVFACNDCQNIKRQGRAGKGNHSQQNVQSPKVW